MDGCDEGERGCGKGIVVTTMEEDIAATRDRSKSAGSPCQQQ